MISNTHDALRMANNTNLGAAKAAKNDEFYTQYADIQKEVNAYLEYNPDTFRDKVVLLPCDDPEWSNFTRFFAQNFERLGLKRLISTSYAVESKKYKNYQPTLFETESPWYDVDKTRIKGKIFELTRDTNGNGRIDIDDLEWHYLEGDGDFRSKEVCKLRDEADIIVTNPPFSLFREFYVWVRTAEKKFLAICNKNCVTYKEVFPDIKSNKVWSGRTEWAGGMWFITTNEDDVDKVIDGVFYKNTPSIWLTNLDHGRRHEPMKLMTMKDNIRYGKNKELKAEGYLHYYNYNAIDVPSVDVIPSDYDGEMGVPISFLDKYCPDQFEIVDDGTEVHKTKEHISYKSKGIITYEIDGKVVWTTPYTVSERKLGNSLRIERNGVPTNCPFGRIIIRKKQNQ